MSTPVQKTPYRRGSDMPLTYNEQREAGLTLVELLVTMTVLGILTTMILVSWFALQKSYAATTRSDHAQVDARMAMSRMVRELRDAEARPGASVIEEAYRDTSAQREYVQFWTKFNHPDRLLLSRYEYNWWTDSATGRITGDVVRIVDWDEDGIDSDDRARALKVLENIVNGDDPSVFAYTSMSAYGDPVISPPSLLPATPAQLATISAVQIRLQVDLNPGKSPAYMDLRSTAQLRNTRQF